MPGTPRQETRNANSQTGSFPVNIFSVGRQNEAFYAVAYSDIPANRSLNSGEINQLLSNVASGFSRSAGGRLLSQQNIRLGSFPGREIRLQLEQGVIARGRIYLVNKRLYQIVVVTNKETSLTRSINGFFNSFKLLNNSTALQNLSPEELNANLTRAVCSQNWPQALQAIDRLIAIAPSPDVRNQLTTYRSQLQGLASSRESIPPASLPDCAAER